MAMIEINIHIPIDGVNNISIPIQLPVVPRVGEKIYLSDKQINNLRFFVKFGGTSSIVNKESWLSVVCFLPYCTSAFLPL